MFAPPAALPDARDATGRLVAPAVFPAGWPDYHARHLPIGGGEQVRVVSVDGVDPGADPGATTPLPTVCLHGWGASAYGYRHVLGSLADRGAAAHAPDLRGHGWSDKPLDPASYTPDALAHWTLRLLNALALDRVVLVGHSLGGAIALHTARLAPDRIAALVLLAPLGLHTVARIEQIRFLTPDPVNAVLPLFANVRTLTALSLRSAYGRIGRPSARDIDEYWAPTADPRFARAARLILHADPWAAFAPDVLAGIAVPVEVVAGTRDNLLSVESLRRVTGALPRGRFDVVPDAGHVLADEAPDRVLAAIARAHAALHDG